MQYKQNQKDNKVSSYHDGLGSERNGWQSARDVPDALQSNGGLVMNLSHCIQLISHIM